MTILGTQGLVIRGWPYPVLMPSQLRKSNVRTKGIADLSLSDRRHLHAALTDKEISVTKVQSKQDRSMYLKYVHNIVLICGVLSEALCDSELPVIIGAPPPADSGHAKAQQMYVNGTIDHEGPPCLPPSKAVTRIKRGVTDEPKTMEGDAIRRIDGAHRRVIYSQATKTILSSLVATIPFVLPKPRRFQRRKNLSTLLSRTPAMRRRPLQLTVMSMQEGLMSVW